MKQSYKVLYCRCRTVKEKMKVLYIFNIFLRYCTVNYTIGKGLIPFISRSENSPVKHYSMSLREFLSILLGYKKPALVPVPKSDNNQKR